MKPLSGTNEHTYTHKEDCDADVFLREEISVQELKNWYLWKSGRTKINICNPRCYSLKINKEKKAG